MFMKHLFVDSCDSARFGTPIFVELRNVKFESGQTIISYIHEQWVSLIPDITIDEIDLLLRKHRSILFLDGLDEVNYDLRDLASTDIMNMSYKYDNSSIIISSRPDQRFASWNEFSCAEIKPFEISQVISLIEKIDYDTDLKIVFVQDIKKRIFKSHSNLLSNPLLCTMMLMTYTEFAEIPSKMHIFYSRAFDVLFARHDATKTAFRRKFYTELPIDTFKRLFSTFCAMSYIDHTYSFKESEIIKYIENSIEFEQIDVNKNDYLNDLRDSISIIIDDASEFSFIHRSFQEYFASVFLSEREFKDSFKYIDRVMADLWRDNVIWFLIDMNKDAFERKYFVKKVNLLKNKISRINSEHKYKEILNLFIPGILDRDGESTGYILGPWIRIIHVIYQYYRPKSRASVDMIIMDLISDTVKIVDCPQNERETERTIYTIDLDSALIEKIWGRWLDEVIESINQLAVDMKARSSRQVLLGRH